MSFKTAKDKLVEIIEDVEPSIQAPRFGRHFKYKPAASQAARFPGSRSFMIELTSVSSVSHRLWSTREKTATVNLVFFYQEVRDSDLLNDVIMSDYEDVVSALSDQSLWDAANSKLEILTDSTEDVFNATIEGAGDDEGLKTVVLIEVPITYTE